MLPTINLRRQKGENPTPQTKPPARWNWPKVEHSGFSLCQRCLPKGGDLLGLHPSPNPNLGTEDVAKDQALGQQQWCSGALAADNRQVIKLNTLKFPTDNEKPTQLDKRVASDR